MRNYVTWLIVLMLTVLLGYLAAAGVVNWVQTKNPCVECKASTLKRSKWSFDNPCVYVVQPDCVPE